MLPPFWHMLHNRYLDDTQRIHSLSNVDTHSRRSRQLHDLPGLDGMHNFPDHSGSLKLPGIRGPDRAENLPHLRDIHGDQLDRYRRPSQGASERQDQEEVRQALRSPTRVSQEGRDTQGRGDDVGRWVQTNMLSSEIGSSSSTPHYSSYSRERDDDWNSSSSRGGSLSGPIHFPDESSYNFGLDDQRKFPPSTYPQSFQRQGPEDNQQRQIVQRSRWQTMLLEAGGFSAAWSEESMRRLRYVLQWLQYATNRIDQQILTIRDFTESLQQHYFEAESTTSINDRTSSAKASGHSHSSSTSTQGLRSRPLSESQTQAISPTHMHKLTLIQHDVVQTIRTVVNVVSEHGGSAALPEPARNAMKGFILKLPKKVRDALRMGGPSSELQVGMERDSAVAAAASGRARSDRRTTARRGTRGDRGLGGSLSAAPSPMSSRANSPSASPRRMPTRGLHSSASSVSLDQDQGVSSSRHGPGHTVSAGTAIVAAQRILTLASESLDMMHGVTGVVKESLERADAWVERLKTLGVQRGDGPSNAQAGSGRPSSSSSTLASEIDSGRMTLNSDSSTMHFVHRDPETDSAPLSPLSVGLNPGRSRRESFGSSTGYNFPGGSLPSTPGLPTSYPSGMYGPNTFSYPGLDAPSPEVGLGLKRMSIRNEGDLVDVKLEEREAEMEVDG
ncbi:transcription factor Opi1-domain-containing protein [Lentinula aciculospora]|uniref:Transcription factor Opi1-domain-containing protein n=1 Tax=Lentinula aciculospora TaxID=153920 RepID=A0A9W9A6C5_9AGAR|nr:transcription factor Opi1-domain-containing protein [Lentinula aciculospora]